MNMILFLDRVATHWSSVSVSGGLKYEIVQLRSN